MSHIHPLDPPAPHRAAGRLGRLAAMGLFDAAPVLETVIDAARRMAPAADPAGLAMRLRHRYADALEDARRAREATIRRLECRLAPLLDRRAPGEALLAAAHAADPACDLTARERTFLVEQAILRRLRSGRSGGSGGSGRSARR